MLRPTSFDVAERAGVSQSTVSRALRGSPGVNAETRARVSAAARELGYVVDRHASSLRLKSSETIALVTICRPGEDRSAINPFYFALLGSIAAATSARGFNLLVSFQESPGNFRADFVASGLADAMIVIGTTSNRPAWQYFAEAQASGLDFTCWGSPGDPFHWMRSDNEVGGQLAAEHLLASGRRRIAFVGPQQSPQRQFDERRDGFTAALAARGIAPVVIAPPPAPDRHAQGVAAAADLLAAHPDVDAIFAASDMLALGVLQGLKDAGRRVPDDIALIGFDGIRAGTLVDPALSTIEPDLDAAGEALVAMALEDTGHSRSGTRIPVRLALRGTA
ncbi:LacI family DNA-binding transcriptional regulator [Sphingopyxis sp. GW247-27LB]|uniref:LacI family DNA-binding transcriptional regulator n=1 Tax=Sphingopyxis sp. GW247-27LB TaxID=2012632 RepID=UPI000BA5E0C1|nr:LacI family DNA-binding transcriptional regulator [Sphingopyxis sp. GW247-27LB]PAL22887.1 LacI family transcriptional regulator [Sphingopyxis sp. GW247-27LB]